MSKKTPLGGSTGPSWEPEVPPMPASALRMVFWRGPCCWAWSR